MECNFNIAFRTILEVEGGLVDDPNDRGGLTKYGISKKAFPNLDIASLTIEQAKAIYRKNYWQPCRCDDLPASFDIAVFDTAINMGCSKAVKLLQKALNINVDGSIGPKTIAAAKAAGETELRNFFLYRLFDYANQTAWKHYGRGWFNRLITVSGVV